MRGERWGFGVRCDGRGVRGAGWGVFFLSFFSLGVLSLALGVWGAGFRVSSIGWLVFRVSGIGNLFSSFGFGPITS